ncbi:MAG TPA: LysM peptidoglycan-binding domain-containing protein [Bacillota bacterium]|nr:LysM peptidoglycan-binding domain-containing protein [Bacillota bacterium]
MKVKKAKKVLLISLVLGSLASVGGYVFGQTYYVQPGDSLFKIAARYGTSVDALLRSNNLGAAASIYPGQAIQIGYSSGSTSGKTHLVQSGESLFLIAQRYGISIDTLKRTNNITSNYLYVGQRLTIPFGSSTGSSSSNYTVKSGDTPYLIAKRYGISLTQLLSINNLNSWSQIKPGQVLQLPTGSSGSPSPTPSISQNDLALLARLVTAESAGEPFEGQVAVAATILNRLKDPRYPKTIPGIIYQIDSGRYQYSPVLDGRINQPATASAYQAVQLALSGWDPSNGANGFYNPAKTTSQWVRSHPATATIGGHVFFNY